jgi:hypothetical protein
VEPPNKGHFEDDINLAVSDLFSAEKFFSLRGSECIVTVTVEFIYWDHKL